MKYLSQYIQEKLHPSKFKKEKEIYFDSFEKFADKFKNEETDFGKPIEYKKGNIEVGKCYIMSENDIRWNGCDDIGGFYIILKKTNRAYDENSYYILQLSAIFDKDDIIKQDRLTIDFCEWNTNTKDIAIYYSAFIKEKDGGDHIKKIPYSRILEIINGGLINLDTYDDIKNYINKFEIL